MVWRCRLKVPVDLANWHPSGVCSISSGPPDGDLADEPSGFVRHSCNEKRLVVLVCPDLNRSEYAMLTRVPDDLDLWWWVHPRLGDVVDLFGVEQVCRNRSYVANSLLGAVGIHLRSEADGDQTAACVGEGGDVLGELPLLRRLRESIGALEIDGLCFIDTYNLVVASLPDRRQNLTRGLADLAHARESRTSSTRRCPASRLRFVQHGR